MRSKYNYNGFTETNSFLGINIHIFDKTQNKWTHHTGQSTCPPEYGKCISTNWETRYQTRQKTGENILYLYKSGKKEYLRGRQNEVFWFDDNQIYNFGEGYSITIPDYTKKPFYYGMFHNFYLSPQDNSNLEYPNRGYPWSNRYYYINQDNLLPFFGVKINDYEEMQWKRDWTLPAGGITQMFYYPNWNSSKDTWNNKADTGNLPTPLDVVVLEQSNKDNQGIPIFMEKYFYAKSGSNSFGLIRFERWNRKEEVCGSTNCCTTQTCEGNLALYNTNTFNNLTYYNDDEDINQYFNPAFYSDPKIEKYPGTPSNGALPRGQFKLLGDGQTTDGQSLKSGDWVQLTNILTDTDFILSEPMSDRHCPVGYQFLGSIATNYINHQQKDKGYGWTEFCGINNNVLLTTTCPTNYESRAWFITPNAFDYLGNNVNNQKINYCVHYNEFHFPKKDINNTKSGDYNNDNKVDLTDFAYWKSQYLQNKMTLVDFSVWKVSYLLN